ncbi:methyltransferase domain-containing protein [uncultured Roseivirga sp.]|uniref:methyltransferase domain-containing protein n=1 Tax=uncultured Roseivirga sp. TaxID=543088 RepID=UPI0030DC672C
MLNKRSYEEELMDDLEASGEVIPQTLKELETINKWLGGNFVTINGLDKLIRSQTKEKLVIADLGCGGGDMLKLVAQWAKQRKLEVELVGFDANPAIVEYAIENCKAYPNIRFEVCDIFSEEFKERQFDVILCTLFTHHFTDEQLINIFNQFKTQAKKGTVINDLHRHGLAEFLIKWLTHFFSKSEMVKNDAPLSVRRAFKKAELEKIMKQANIPFFKLRWMWAFRWQLIF